MDEAKDELDKLRDMADLLGSHHDEKAKEQALELRVLCAVIAQQNPQVNTYVPAHVELYGSDEEFEDLQEYAQRLADMTELEAMAARYM